MNVKKQVQDQMKIIAKEIKSSDTDNVLLFLYQPIIGYEAVSVYLTMWTYIGISHNRIPNISHQDFIDNCKINIKKFETSIKKLEALKLISTNLDTVNGNNSFVYIMHNPLSGDRFFKSIALSKLLKDSCTQQQYNEKLASFVRPVILLDEKNDISAEFTDVFKRSEFNLTRAEQFRSDVNHKVELTELIDLFKANGFPVSTLKDKVLCDQIVNACLIYELSMIDILTIFKSTDKKVTKNNFQSIVNNYMLTRYDGQNLVAVNNIQPLHYTSEEVENETIKEFIEHIENISPSRYLQQLLGRKPTMPELMLIENAMNAYKLTPAIINIIMNYILEQKNNLEIKPKYFDKIASDFFKRNIVKSTQAIRYLKKVNQDDNIYSGDE